MDVIYKNNKRYNTAKKPLRQNFFWMGLIYILSRIMLIGKKKSLKRSIWMA